MARTEKGRIIHPGMGGFLNPPTHPEHDWHVETDLRRRPENRGGMSLTAAAEATWLDSSTRAEAKKLLKSWRPPPPNSPEIIDWRQQMLGYFKTMYRNDNAPSGHEWDASTMYIDPERDPILNADAHAGVHYIRKFYPDYVPTETDFEGAYWGTKPDRSTLHASRRTREPDDWRSYSMTYGELPPFEKFERWIHTKIDPERDGEMPYWPPGTLYPMELVGAHEVQLANDFGGLEQFETERRRSGRNSGAIGFKGDEHAIYGFLEYLVEEWGNGDEEAGDLASSIMTTLGYEWI